MAVTFKRETNAQRAAARLATRERIAEKLSRRPAVELICTATVAKHAGKHNAARGTSTRARATGSRRTSIKRGATREQRTAVENLVIYRTHAKRLGIRLKLGQRDIKVVAAQTAKERELAKTESRGLALWAAATGKLWVNAIRARIRKEGLIDTGQLLDSFSYGTKNI